MSLAANPPEPRNRRMTFDDELDRLVAREFEQLVAQKRAPARKTEARPPEPPEASADADAEADAEDMAPPAAERPAASAARGAAPESAKGKDGNVIGFARASARTNAPVLPFSPQEEAFIENSVAFLRQCANRDLIVEEIWLLTANREDELSGQTPGASEEFEAPDPGPDDEP